MSARRKAQRRIEIEAVRQSARDMYADGKSRGSCPYRYCNQYQWENEWDRCHQARLDAEREAQRLNPGCRIVTQLVREETYCFTPNNGEKPVHIRSGQLREMLLEYAMDKVIDLTFPTQTALEIIEMHGLEGPRMASMTETEALEPVIVGFWPLDGTNILIDGAHRRWYWAARGVNTIRGWAVPYSLWEQFTFDPTAPGVIRYSDSGAELPQRRGRG